MKAQHKSGFSLLLSLIFLNDGICCLFSSKKKIYIIKDYKRDTWKNTDVVFFTPAYLPGPPHAHSSLPRLLPIFFLSSKAVSLSRRNARPFFQVAQPPQFSFHMSGCAIQQSFVGTCWEGFFSVSVPEAHTQMV